MKLLRDMFMGPDHSIRESLLVNATLMGFFNHMKNKTSNPSFIFFYFVIFVCIPALLLSYKSW